ncbi:MAG: biotin--[acetyl-CoA-carboxylase] ligase [Devosiaceae bacterium]|nr:biotin--[acetyl-CoA-carboxylase] ligase [Devosiaceae bacterium]
MSIKFALGPKAALAGYGVKYIETTPSTNQLAFEYIAGLAKDETHAHKNSAGIWFVADQQTAGRARLGRTWLSEEGNLTASLLLTLPKQTQSLQILSFVAAIALADAVDLVVGEASKQNLKLKWPNDLLFFGGKLAGILIEAQILGDGRYAIILGFGVNIKSAPSGITYPVSSICQSGANVTRQSLFCALSDSWQQKFSLWNYGRRSKEVLSQWRNRAFGIGKPINVNQSGKILSGIFLDIDDSGHLVLLQENNKTIHVSAGDVNFEAEINS